MSHVGNGDAVLGLKSHGVTSAKDLKGKKVGYASGMSSESILRLTLESAGLTMKDVKAMEMDASGIVSAMTSGSLDACATWSPNTFTIKDVMKDDAVTLANNLTFADKSAAISSWIVMSKYAETNSDKLLRFTKGLYKGMDYRAANIEQTAKWVAKVLAADYNTIWNQRGDAEWITSEQLVKEVKDGTIEHLYEVQKKGFGTAVKQETPVSSYVLFDNMLKAGQLIPSLKEK
jgi:NitT/TauT family transport system substrate-binding protein